MNSSSHDVVLDLQATSQHGLFTSRRGGLIVGNVSMW